MAAGYAVADEILRDPRMLVDDRELAAFYGTATARAAEEVVLAVDAAHQPARPHPDAPPGGRRVHARAGWPMRDAVTAQADNPGRYLAHSARPRAGRLHHRVRLPAADPGHLRAARRARRRPALVPASRRRRSPPCSSRSLLLDDVRRRERARSRLRLYFLDLVAQRREEPREDLTTALVAGPRRRRRPCPRAS